MDLLSSSLKTAEARLQTLRDRIDTLEGSGGAAAAHAGAPASAEILASLRTLRETLVVEAASAEAAVAEARAENAKLAEQSAKDKYQVHHLRQALQQRMRAMAAMPRLLAVLAETPRPVGHPDVKYGTAGFRACVEGGVLDHVFLRMGMLACLRAMKLQSVTGAVITASHNAECDNGIKICEAKGDMLESSWEAYGTVLANCADAGSALAFMLHVAAEQGIELGAAAHVHVARDTRPSSEYLQNLLMKGVEAMGGTVRDYGVLTTPQLHFTVRARNAGEDDTEEAYYRALEQGYRLITQKKSPGLLIVDCSNGVGAGKLHVLRDRLKDLITIEMRNVEGDGPVNEGCGAEHVQKGRAPPANFDMKKDAGPRLASFDGDADRLVYFYSSPKEPGFRLLDGDKIAALATMFIKKQLDAVGLTDKLNVGVVQTAYANGAAQAFLSKEVKVPVVFTPTGVKHLHTKAHEFDVGVYFEANGHGTVLFSDKAMAAINRAPEGEAGEAAIARNRLRGLTIMINQAVGDALSDMLLVECILSADCMGVDDWDALYRDLPSRQLKVTVADRTVVRPQWDETRLIEPVALQKEIDSLVAKGGASSRGFVRPSGTEDVVRIYAEARTEAAADKLALAFVKAIYTKAGGVGKMQTKL